MTQVAEEAQTIDGHTYKVRMLDPLDATDLLADLMGVVGPALSALAPLSDLKKKLTQLDEVLGAEEDETMPAGAGVAVEKALLSFFQRFTKKQQRELIETMMRVSFVEVGDGKEVPLRQIFSVHFRGRPLSLYRWLFFALKVQYQDFFSSIGSVISPVVRKMGLGQ